MSTDMQCDQNMGSYHYKIVELKRENEQLTARIAKLEAALADSHAVVVRQAIAACMALGLPSNPVRVHPLLVKDAEVGA